MWPFGTIATLRREKDEYKATMGRLLSEARDAQLREAGLEASRNLWKKAADAFEAERDAESRGRIAERESKDNVVKEIRQLKNDIEVLRGKLSERVDEREAFRAKCEQLEAELRVRIDNLEVGKKTVAEQAAEIKRLTAALAKAQKNDSPQDKKSGRFVKKAPTS